MYSWGDLAELLLGVLLFWGWLRERDRARERARGKDPAPAHAPAFGAEGGAP
ncbi:hypothetical protein [Deinococcus wulumuqiensis]|uniref:hypothetical protein n=1 Tax=Deinococcus wulumuqiensis TaxID=980427 RepID=UPI001966EA59|nr:hypothetical protein [Deinococcus wulumuqiensis]